MDSKKHTEQNRFGKTIHKTVLLQEVASGLSLKEGDILLDATVNNAGHSGFISENLKGRITVVGIDEDEEALKRADVRLERSGAKFHLYKGNFRNLDEALKNFGIEEIDGAIFDLGLSSEELEESGRGFSFQKDEPLLMTFGSKPQENAITARYVVNNFSEENLESVIRGYGEESFSKRIAKAIAEGRQIKPIETTFELREIITNAVPIWYRKGRIHPATKTFQAIRIAVNDEINAMREGLEKALRKLKRGGRIAVISFHSIEDREVKNIFKKIAKEKIIKILTKKPIVPTHSEISENPRSRSAKLRIAEKI